MKQTNKYINILTLTVLCFWAQISNAQFSAKPSNITRPEGFDTHEEKRQKLEQEEDEKLELEIKDLIYKFENKRAAKPPSGGATSPWVRFDWNSSGKYVPNNAFPLCCGDLSTFSFPQSGRNVAYPTFLTTTTITNLLGNLTGKTITATFTLTTTGNPDFIWGGKLAGWNPGPNPPANTRFFISSRSDAYSNPNYTACPNCYWWCHEGVTIISINTGTVTISATFDPTKWSNAIGQLGNNNLAAFQAVVNETRQLGLAYSGGSFFDCGIAILNGTGSGTFHLNSFTVN